MPDAQKNGQAQNKEKNYFFVIFFEEIFHLISRIKAFYPRFAAMPAVAE